MSQAKAQVAEIERFRREIVELEKRLVLLADALYDTVSAPWEVDNLAESDSHPVVLERMRQQLRETMRDVADTGVIPEGLFGGLAADRPISIVLRQEDFDYDRLLELVPRNTSFFESFRIADDVLRQAVQGIADIITTPGLINRDFSDIRSIMLGMGYAMMGTATAAGEKAAIEAARSAISCPLLEEGGVRGARGILINITASSRLGLHDVNEACSLIRGAASNEDVQINFGVVVNEAIGDEVKITVIATGFDAATKGLLNARGESLSSQPVSSRTTTAARPPRTPGRCTSGRAERTSREAPSRAPPPPGSRARSRQARTWSASR